jgi:prepilin-type N-terminal cleavage/methylation domain-containing protein
MFSRFRHQQGFTLIELLIVVAIIGVLATLVIPRFAASTIRTKQSEAKGILKQVYSMQRAYKQEFGFYWGNGITADAVNPTNFARINVTIGVSARYTYSIAATATSFTVTANVAGPGLDDDPAPDTWTIDQDGNLQATSDDVMF